MPQYAGTIPNIAQAYQNDPRTRLAASMLASGTSTAPVAQGGWAVTDGLARAAQAIAGAFVNRGQDKKYSAREQQYMKGLSDAAQLASQNGTPNPAVANPATANPGTQAMATAAQALAPPTPQPPPMSGQGVPQPIPSIDPGASSAPQAPALALPKAPQAYAQRQQQLSANDLYYRGIVPIEGGTGPNGQFLTSPKGAIGPGQIMPGTGPEAAKLAGVPWNPERFKSDPEYNNALGSAYYSAQLQRFGDPVLAAAAYNAGPGRVQRALRLAQKNGTDPVQYLPAETQKYITSFRTKVSISGGSPVEGVGPVGVAPPTMEQVPNAPQMPTAADRPKAPDLPPEVISNRIAMAQELLKSGNPDLVAMAETYLDKGLGEQNDARTLRSQQQFAQGQTGYTSDLGDYNDARQQGRQYGIDAVRDAQQRNFGRENLYRQQTFQSAEGAADRAQQARIASQQQNYQSTENRLDRENSLEVAGIKGTGRGSKNPFLDTPTGLKMQQQLYDDSNKNQESISKVQRFMDLNKKQSTGGVAMGLGGAALGELFGDAEISEMSKISKDTTLAKLGGSLGVAISDGDRKFITASGLNLNSPKTANDNTGKALIGALRRQNDFKYNFALAQMNNQQQDFQKTWKLFVESTPIVKYGKDGNLVGINDEPPTYEEWLNSRPKYDASGRRVN